MPMYEYQCAKCDHLWELLQKMSDPAPKTCPDCKSRRVGKMLSQTSFVLKGGGWYADGYSGDKKKKEAKASPDTANSSKPSSDTSKSSKPSSDTSKSSKPSSDTSKSSKSSSSG